MTKMATSENVQKQGFRAEDIFYGEERHSDFESNE